MKAITVIQPWASAITDLGKRIENRKWQPKGLRNEFLAIHSGRRIDEAGWEALRREGWPIPDIGYLPLSSIVAVATFTTVHTGPATLPPGQAVWWSGPLGWEFVNVRKIEPIPCKGAQGLWEVPEYLIPRIIVALDTAERSRRR